MQIGQIDLGTHLAPPQAGGAAQKPARRRRSRAVLREGKKTRSQRARAPPASHMEGAGLLTGRSLSRATGSGAAFLAGLRAPEDAAVRRVSVPCVHLISLTLRGRVLRVIGCKPAG